MRPHRDRSRKLWLNGQRTVDYTGPDATIPQAGVFGLQIPQGAASEAWYEDLTIQVLPDKPQRQRAIHIATLLGFRLD